LSGLINLASICYQRKESEPEPTNIWPPSSSELILDDMYDLHWNTQGESETWYLDLLDEEGEIKLRGDLEALSPFQIDLSTCELGESSEADDGFSDFHSLSDNTIRDITRQRALETIRLLTQIPASHPGINLQAIPLFTAGSELSKEDEGARVFVMDRYKALYSTNHLRVNLLAIDMLKELWALRDSGHPTTWLSLMMEKQEFLLLG
jgi:hypothetical protein